MKFKILEHRETEYNSLEEITNEWWLDDENIEAISKMNVGELRVLFIDVESGEKVWVVRVE